MFDLEGMGPKGLGPMNARRLGACARGQGGCPAHRHGRGTGRWGWGSGRDCGRGSGAGRGMVWAAVGYGPGGEATAAATIRSALEGRRAFLRAELSRTEALLAAEAAAVGREG